MKGFIHSYFQIGALVRDRKLHPNDPTPDRQGIVLKIGELPIGIPDRRYHYERYTRILVYWSGAPAAHRNGEHWCDWGRLEVINENR